MHALSAALHKRKHPRGGARWPVPGRSEGSGQLPPQIANVEQLGNQSSTTVPSIERDQGVSGVVNGQVLFLFGDASWFSGQNHEFAGIRSNCAGVGNLSHPTEIYDHIDPDTNGGVYNFIESSPDELAESGAWSWAYWCSQIVEAKAGGEKGLVFFSRILRPDKILNFKGSSVAEVYAPANGRPYTKRSKTVGWSQDEPVYGDIAATTFQDHVYAFGHGPKNSSLENFAFITRAPIEQALTSKDSYEYWNQANQAWEKNLTLSKEAAILNERDLFSGSVFWSNYYNAFLMVVCNQWGDSTIVIRHSDKPEGPWSEPVTVFKDTEANPFLYSPAGHPWSDNSGKTLLISYSFSPSVIKMLKITFA